MVHNILLIIFTNSRNNLPLHISSQHLSPTYTMLKKIPFFITNLMLIGCFITQSSAQALILSGTIQDYHTQKPVSFATVSVKKLVKRVVNGDYTNVRLDFKDFIADSLGKFSQTLPSGEYIVEATAVGYSNKSKYINLKKETEIILELSEKNNQLDEVEVKAKKAEDNIRSTESGIIKLNIQNLKKLPIVFGEGDIIKALTLQPGVTTVGEGAGGFNVRGGKVDQNLVLLDDAPVYNSSHLLGFFSVFNPDAVKDVKLYKGGIPSQFGGRASSILDVRMKEGNAKKLEINGGIGLIFSRISIEAPIVKDKASFIVAARRSYADILAGPFLSESQKNNLFNFYDLTAKVNYNINQKNTVFLSGYFGRDVFGQRFSFNWGNSTLSARWNHVFSDKLFMNTTVFYSNYDYLLDTDAQNKSPNDAFKWSSNIVNRSIKPDFTYYFSPNNTLTFGGQILTYSFKPGTASVNSGTDKFNIGQPDKNGVEYSAYVGNELKISDKFSVQYGLRYSKYDYSSKDDVYYQRKTVPTSNENPNGIALAVLPNKKDAILQSYQNFEPRLSMKLQLGEQSSFKSSFNRMSQYIHLMSNTAAATPLDVWTSSTNNIKPQIADQVTLGYFKNFGETGNDFEASVEVYYKKLQNQIDYADNSDLFLNASFEKDLLFGNGRAYGVKFFLKKIKEK